MTVLGRYAIQDSLSNNNLRAHRGLGNKLEIEPASMDVHLGGNIKYPVKDPDEKVVVDDESTYPEYISEETDRPVVTGDGFALATTQENVSIPNDMVALLHGRSSVGRLGLFIENAGLIDPGFQGQITLELTNVEPWEIELVEGMRIGQLTFHHVDNAPDVGYSAQNGNKYDNQSGPTPSRLYEDFEDE